MSVVRILLILHVAAGVVGFLTFWIPLVLKKGGRAHKRVGWVYVWAMGVVGVTAQAVCGLRLVDDNPGNNDGALFLMLVGLLAASSASAGIRALRMKGATAPSPHPWDLVLSGSLVLGGVPAALYGVMVGKALFIAFGLLCAVVGSTQVGEWLRAPSSRMAYWYRHMGGMLVSGIATVTAVLVVNIGTLGLREHALLVWTMPGVVGAVVIARWTRHYRRKFREDGGPGLEGDAR